MQTLIQFESKPYNIGTWTVLKLPPTASKKLPSRAMTMVKGTVNKHPFKTVLEPDGQGSHWFKIDEKLQKETKVKAGSTVDIEIEPSQEWIEPDVPSDLKKALSDTPKAHDLWKQITPNARWDWIRWIRATKNPETRVRRIEVSMSKMTKGERRPCCFNRNACTEPYVVSNKWILIEPN